MPEGERMKDTEVTRCSGKFLTYWGAVLGFPRGRLESDRKLRRRIQLALMHTPVMCTRADLLSIPGVRRVETPAPGHVVIRIPWWYPWKRRTRETVKMIMPVVMLPAVEYRAWWW
jgi:hypothetical protein